MQPIKKVDFSSILDKAALDRERAEKQRRERGEKEKSRTEKKQAEERTPKKPDHTFAENRIDFRIFENPGGALRKSRFPGAGFLFSHALVDNRRFPTRSLQGERPCASANPANGDRPRRPLSNRGIASRRSAPRSETSSSRLKPNAAMVV
jgi:hypothetical protein